MMNFAKTMMNFANKMMNFVFKMTNFVFRRAPALPGYLSAGGGKPLPDLFPDLFPDLSIARHAYHS